MSDWEDSVDNKPHAIVKPVKKWDDEDVDENDVIERWEDMESSDEEKEKAKPTPAALQKKKKSAAQKAIEKKGKMINNEDDNELDESERKKREHQAVIDADLENTKGMFQGVSIKETEVEINSLENAEGKLQSITIKETKSSKSSPLDKIDPRTKEEFEEFSKLLINRIRRHERQGMYVNFINEFIRELCLPLKDTEVRKVASALTILANEKQKEMKEKDKSKKKGKTKPSLQVENFDSVGDYDYTDDYDYDDFI